MVQLFLKFLKFGMVGFTGLLIDFGITWILKERLRWHRYLANSTGFIIAATSNYFLNRIWTFQSHNDALFVEYSSFIVIAMIGLIINNTFLYLFEKNFSFYFSKFLAIAVTTFWNFTANYLFTFQ